MENKIRKTAHHHLQWTSQIIFKLIFFGHSKKEESEAVTVEVGNNLVAIRNLQQVTLSYCPFGSTSEV